jgi:hypothetical protein
LKNLKKSYITPEDSIKSLLILFIFWWFKKIIISKNIWIYYMFWDLSVISN